MADTPTKNRFWALYSSWDGLVWCKILPRGVGTICPYFWQVSFVTKNMCFDIQYLLYYYMYFKTVSLSSMFETKCYRQNDRIDRGIISRFRRNNNFLGNTLLTQSNADSPLFNCLYNWFISSNMRNTDKFVLDLFCSSPPRYPLAPFGSLWGSLGFPLAVLWGPFGCPGVLPLPGRHFPSKYVSSTVPAHKI